MQYKLQSATLCPTSLLISIPRHTLTAVALTFTLTLLAIGRRNTQPRKPFSLPDLDMPMKHPMLRQYYKTPTLPNSSSPLYYGI